MQTANQVPIMMEPFVVNAPPAPSGAGGGGGGGGFGDILKNVVSQAAQAATAIGVARAIAKNAPPAPANGVPTTAAPATVAPVPGAGQSLAATLPPWLPIAGVGAFVILIVAVVIGRGR